MVKIDLKLTLLLIFLLPFITGKAHARLLDPDETLAVMLNSDITYDVKKDGTYERIYKRSIQIKKQQGIKSWGTFTASYPGDGYEIKKIKATIQNGSDTISVREDKIDISRKGGDESGFDDEQVVTVSYPGVKIGSILNLEMHSKMTKTPIPDYFDTSRTYGDDIPVQNARLKIISDKKLYFGIFNEKDAFKITENKKNERYIYEAKSTKVIFNRIGFELEKYFKEITPRNANLRFSSAENYSDLAKKIIPSYEKVLQDDLPGDYKNMIEGKDFKGLNLEEKTDYILSKILDSHRYMGDWRTVKGGHVPRKLDEINRTKYGDCKDLSAIVTAIFRKLGYEANIAWIFRNSVNYPLIKELPYDGEFNHAIVHLRFNGNNYWIDPTNSMSVGLRIRDDIFDRYALILDPKNPRLEKTPLNDPLSSMQKHEKIIYHNKDGSMTDMISISFTGLEADDLNRVTADIPPKNHPEFWIYVMKNEYPRGAFHDFKLDAPSNRISKNIKASAKVTYENFGNETSAGLAYEVNPEISWAKNLDLDNTYSDLFLGSPATKIELKELKSVKIIGQNKKTCKVTSRWLDLEKSIAQKGGDVKITTKLVKKKTFIANHEMKEKTFEKFIKDIIECDKDYQIIYKPI